MTTSFLFEPLDVSIHDRAAFTCGVEPLDRYIRQQARKNIQHRVAAVFVLRSIDQPGTIIGYYTLSNATIDAAELPTDLRHRAPRYPVYPATLIGRLAVDQRYRGQGQGERLLYDALYKSLQQSITIASIAVIVDAKDDAARAFYEHHGFLRLIDHPYRLYLPMKTIAQMFEAAV